MVDTTRANGTDLFDSDGKVIGALIALYYCQEADERSAHATAHQNGRGFNMIDAGILSDMSQFYLRKGYLSPKQLTFLRGRLSKYKGQLAHLDVQEMPNSWQTETPPAAEAKTYRRVTMEGTKTLIIEFSYDPRLVDELKSMTGRRWDSERKRWTAVASYNSAKRLKELGFDFSEQAEHWWQNLAAPTRPAAVAARPPLSLAGLKRKPFPYQLDGVRFIDAREGRAIIGDEMGLGKTFQVITWVHARRRALPGINSSVPALIICPASVKLNWAREFAMSSDLTVHVITGSKPSPLPRAHVYVINYNLVPAWKDELAKVGLMTIVCDESHYIKTRDSDRTLAIAGGEKKVPDPKDKKKKIVVKHWGLAQNVPHILCLSGTPIINRPVEIFVPARLIQPDLFPSFWKFAETYCDAKHDGYGWDFTGASNTKELHEILSSTIMLRRLKKDVLPDLPPKMRTVIPLIVPLREYKKAESDFKGWLRANFGTLALDKAKRAEALVRIEKLKQLAFRAKMHGALEWIEDYLSQNNKLVIFATHTEVLRELEAVYGDMCVTVDGSTPNDQRQAAVDLFQNNPSVRVFLGNIKAAGVGLTLTAASATCFLELGWTPGEHDQAEDRVHRIGQEADSVFAYYLLAAGTIDEQIAELIDDKRRVLNAVLDGKMAMDKNSMLTALLDKQLNAA